MAFPTIQAADTQHNTVTSNSSSWTLTYPTNLASGDLILAFVASDGVPTFTWPGGFLDARKSSGANVWGWAKKLSDGTEAGTFSLGLSASEQGAWRLFRITNWHGMLGAGVGSGDCTIGTSGSWTTGTNANPDPPSLDPADWDVEDTLWFAFCSVDTSRTISVFPLADNQSSDVSGGAGGATLGLCSTDSAVSSLDPGTFTISTSDDWAAATVAVRPAAAAAVVVTRDPWPALQAVNRSNVY